jgi:hypothetical protein
MPEAIHPRRILDRRNLSAARVAAYRQRTIDQHRYHIRANLSSISGRAYRYRQHELISF